MLSLGFWLFFFSFNVFLWTAAKEAKELGVDLMRVSPIVPLAAIPPWLFQEAKVHLTPLGKNTSRNVQTAYRQLVWVCTDIHRCIKKLIKQIRGSSGHSRV